MKKTRGCILPASCHAPSALYPCQIFFAHTFKQFESIYLAFVITPAAYSWC